MPRAFFRFGTFALAGVLLAGFFPSSLQAQANIPTEEELDQLLAPVALYPDALLAQITTASTNPQEILDADNWLRQNSGLNGPALANAAQAQGFDPAFVALASFPQVLDMMAANIDDYAAIGAAFQADPNSVMDSVQRLRENAYDSGALRSTPQQQVIVEPYNGQQYIVIQPANSQMVYLPQYDPGVIYRGGYAGGPLITFGIGIGFGWASSYPWGWGGWGWNWRQRSLLYNHLIWRPHYNRYRPTRYTYRPRPPNYHNRPVIQPIRPRPGRPNQGRPVPSRPRPTHPGRPSIQPVRPGQPSGRPPRPGNGVRPAPVPSRPRPGQPSIQPAPQRPQQRPKNRPAPQRPQQGPENRPAPRPRPAPQPNNP